MLFCMLNWKEFYLVLFVRIRQDPPVVEFPPPPGTQTPRSRWIRSVRGGPVGFYVLRGGFLQRSSSFPVDTKRWTLKQMKTEAESDFFFFFFPDWDSRATCKRITTRENNCAFWSRIFRVNWRRTKLLFASIFHNKGDPSSPCYFVRVTGHKKAARSQQPLGDSFSCTVVCTLSTRCLSLRFGIFTRKSTAEFTVSRTKEQYSFFWRD